MSIFLQPEWGNFLFIIRKRPWLWPRLVWELWSLVFRRIVNTLHMKVMGKAHRGLKRWPHWLSPMDTGFDLCQQGQLTFPAYRRYSCGQSPRIGQIVQFGSNDPEGYLASHRWGDCYIAAFEDRFSAKEALEQALSWIRNQPPKSDRAWEPYSSCERVVNLAVMLSIHPKCWSDLGAKSKFDIAAFFVESAYWIISRLEYYGKKVTNNHILNNARALVVAGSVTGNDHLVQCGLACFHQMSQELIQSGGFLRERSSHYQYIVTNWLMDTLHFAPWSPNISDRTREMIDELTALAERVSTATGLLASGLDGLQTHIGDISPDNHPSSAILRLRCLYPQAFLKECPFADEQRDEWVFVSAGKHQLIACGMPVKYPLNYKTHGHCDLGSFVWAYNRQLVLVDSGRGSYITDDQTSWQCGPQGHNLITVQGLAPLCDTLLSTGYWCPSVYSKAGIHLKTEKGASFLLKHDGFKRVPGVGEYNRLVQFEEESIVILDSLEGTGIVDVDMYWHFPEGFIPLTQDICISAESGLQVRFREDNGMAGASANKWEKYPLSIAYGGTHSAYMLHTHRTISLPWVATTILHVKHAAHRANSVEPPCGPH